MSGYDERITTYFGDPVLRAGFMPVPHLLMRHYHALGLQTDHAMFVLQLMEITWDLAQPPTTIRKLAERMGVSVRSVQRYSEYLAARELIIIYEQFANGAQVENGYDLSPLFERLAALAPEPPLSGTPRERRRRATGMEPAAPIAVAASPVNRQSAAAQSVQSAPLASRIPTHEPPVVADKGRDVTVVTGGHVTADIPALVTRISPAATGTSPFKRVKNSLKKHQEQIQPGGGGNGTGRSAEPAGSQAASAGWSLRWQQALTADDVTASAAVLEQFGVHDDVAQAAANALAPPEAWALGAYAVAARLGPGWIAKQVFAFDTRQPRRASLAARYDEIGRTLAALGPAESMALLALIDRSCPHEPDAVLHDGAYHSAPPALQRAAALLWTLMNELRHGSVPQLMPPTLPAAAGPRLTPAQGSAAPPGLWQQVLTRLQAQVPAAEFATWFAQVSLLDLDADRAVIGTANVFVREQVEACYLPLITAALHELVGRPVLAQAVVGGAP